MSYTAKIINHLEITLNNDLKEVGSRVTAQEITVDGLVYEARTTVATEYVEETLWETGDGNVDSFDILAFESDQDVLLCLRNDAGTDEFALFKVEANVPLILTSDDLRGRDDGTSPVGDGSGSGTVTTLKQVDKITVQNNSTGGTTANVRLLLLD